METYSLLQQFLVYPEPTRLCYAPAPLAFRWGIITVHHRTMFV